MLKSEDAPAAAPPARAPFPWLELSRLMTACLEGPFLREMWERRRETATLSSTLGYVDAAFLYALVRVTRPRVVVETGTYRGFSAAFILQALQDAGADGASVTSVDRKSGGEIGMLVPERLRPGLRLVAGDVRELADREGALPPRIDFFFHDSTHRFGHQLWEYATFWARLSDGGCLASHDVDLNASFAHFVEGTYRHDAGGRTDWSRTAHLDWGRFGAVGFVRKAAGAAVPDSATP